MDCIQRSHGVQDAGGGGGAREALKGGKGGLKPKTAGHSLSLVIQLEDDHHSIRAC